MKIGLLKLHEMKIVQVDLVKKQSKLQAVTETQKFTCRAVPEHEETAIEL